MGLIDIINEVPVKIASKISKATKTSKYDLANICNFTGSLPSAYVAVEAYKTGFTPAMLAGGLLTALHGIFVIYNANRAEHENPRTIEKLAEKHSLPDYAKKELEKRVEQANKSIRETERRSAPAGLGYCLIGLGFATISASAFGVNVEIDNISVSDIATYAGLLSPSLMLNGIAHYFRAIPKEEKK